jgi:glutamine amidotransferase
VPAPSGDYAISFVAQNIAAQTALDEAVRGRQVPVLGVCVGLQMLARGSEEGSRPGLGWIRGEVRRLDSGAGGLARRVPHMGWNDVRVTRSGGLFRGLDAPRFYFLHSFHLICDDGRDVLAVADYEGSIVCAVAAGHIHGVQFHPEKSHRWGKALLQNFAGL